MELAERQLTGAIAIHDSELLFETDQALGASRRDPVLELVNDDRVLCLPGLTVTGLWEFLLSLVRLLECVVLLRILAICHGAGLALLSWHLSSATILPDSVRSDALSLWSAPVVLGSVLEWVISALHTAVHSSFTGVLLCKATVRASSTTTVFGTRSGRRFSLIDGHALGISPVLGCVASDVP